MATTGDSKKKDFWDILSGLTPLIVGLCITGVGAAFTQVYNFRQLQLTQIQALDKFRPLLTSPSPPEREFAYATFAALGYEELALKIIGLSKDSSGTAVAEQLEKSDDPAVRSTATNTLHELSGVDKLINKFETGSPEGLRPRVSTTAQQLGLKTDLAIAVLQDTMTAHGTIKRYVEAANTELNGSPKDGVAEKAWLLSFLKARIELARVPSMRRFDERRVGELRALIEAEDWNLKTVK